MTRASVWVAALAYAAFAQTAPEHVIRIEVNLVQVDAVVTDARGKPVPGLTAADFEILQDGKPQPITAFSYVSLDRPKTPAPATPPVKGAPAVPPAKLKLEDVRRTIALVVDDLGLSFESTAAVRDALKKFVDREMQPGDLAAIIRTGAGIGALQQFTTDKRILYAAIDRVKFNAFGRVGISSFAPIGRDGEGESAWEQTRSAIFSVGTLGAIRYVVDGLRELPGRKAVVLFSEHLNLQRNTADERVVDALRMMVDAANRASVVVYTVDPGGLRVHGPTAADNVSPERAATVAMERSAEEFNRREGLVILAQDTGGRFFANTNDVSGAVRDVVQDTESYYLIGYRPSAETFDAKTGRPRYHRIRVRLKRPGLRVRSRTGFLGTPDRETAPAPRTRQGQIAKAISSPFAANGVEVRLTPLFTQGLKGSYLNTLLYINGKDLTFTDDADGWKKAVIDIVGMTFGDNGQAVDSSDRTYTVRVRGKAFEEAQKGLLYSVRHPIRKPGAYQMRVVVRDAGSENVGSASQFVEVPDVGKGRLTLSSIVMQQDAREGALKGPETEEGQIQAPDIQGSPAVRSFRQGSAIVYGYEILNARRDDAKLPHVESQIRLFRDGKPVYEGKPQTLSFDNQGELKRLLAAAQLKLGTKIAPGDYVLQVTVTDALAKEGRRTATQWIDFEIRQAEGAGKLR